jgi:hypothetical protein
MEAVYSSATSVNFYQANTSKNRSRTYCDLLFAGYLLGLLFDPEDGSNMLL